MPTNPLFLGTRVSSYMIHVDFKNVTKSVIVSDYVQIYLLDVMIEHKHKHEDDPNKLLFIGYIQLN